MGSPAYRERVHSINSELPLVTLAAKITREWGDTVPTPAQLRTRYGMSIATSHRWHNALRDSMPAHALRRAGCSASEIALAMKEPAHA